MIVKVNNYLAELLRTVETVESMKASNLYTVEERASAFHASTRTISSLACRDRDVSQAEFYGLQRQINKETLKLEPLISRIGGQVRDTD